MIFFSAFGANSNSGGEYVTELLINKFRSTYSSIKFIEVSSRWTTLAKFNSILLFIICPLLHPQIIRRFRLKELELLKKESEVYFNFTQTFIYSIFIPKAKKKFIIHDVLLQVEVRTNRFFLLPIVYLWEFIFFKLVPNVELLVLSRKDKAYMMNFYFVKAKKIKIIDLYSYLKYDKLLFNEDKTKVLFSEKTKFGILGAWGRRENSEGLVKFLKLCKIYGLVDLNILLCGSNLHAIDEAYFEGFSNLNKIGFVADISHFFNNIDYLIIPLEKGGGVKIKVLQAILHGVPCIGTKVAFEGINLPASKVELDDIKKMVFYLLKNGEKDFH
jgi:hypothetical protein